jgi:nicotinate-nucleotide adenylyltransferase
VAHLGLLGGTFNPPHVGHLVCAAQALAQLTLDCVLFVPVYEPPHKEAEADPGVEHRVELCRRAVAGDERLVVSRVDADVPGPSFTIATLRRLNEHRPGDQLTFIVGGDMALSLPTWRERGADRLRFFDMPRLDVSSSLIRRMVAAGRPIRYLVPDGVAAYVEEAGLYR